MTLFWSLRARPGALRLKAAYAPNLINARNTLTEQMQHESFDLTTRLLVSGMKDGERVGLTMFGVRASWIGIVQSSGERHVVFANSTGETAIAALQAPDVQFRVHVADEKATFFWSIDGGHTFQPAGPPNNFYFSWWKAARPALFNFNTDQNIADKGFIDVDWVRYVPVTVPVTSTNQDDSPDQQLPSNDSNSLSNNSFTDKLAGSRSKL